MKKIITFLLILSLSTVYSQNQYFGFYGGSGETVPTALFNFSNEFKEYDMLTPILQVSATVTSNYTQLRENMQWNIFNVVGGARYGNNTVYTKGMIGSGYDFEAGFSQKFYTIAFGYQNYRNFRISQGDYKASVLLNFTNRLQSKFTITSSNLNTNYNGMMFGLSWKL